SGVGGSLVAAMSIRREGAVSPPPRDTATAPFRAVCCTSAWEGEEWEGERRRMVCSIAAPLFSFPRLPSLHLPAQVADDGHPADALESHAAHRQGLAVRNMLLLIPGAAMDREEHCDDYSHQRSFFLLIPSPSLFLRCRSLSSAC